MKKKIFGIIVCMMMVVFALNAMGTYNKIETSKTNLFNNNISQNFAPGQLIVKIKKDTTFSHSVQLIDLSKKHQVYDFEKMFSGFGDTILDNIYLLHVPIDSDIISIVQDYILCPDVIYAEPNWIASLHSIPNDVNFSNQWYLHNTGQLIYGNIYGTYDADIDAPEAWDLEIGNSDVAIAIIDSGIDYTHPDLAGKIWNNTDEIPNNGIDDDGNGYIDDIRGWNFANDTNDPIDEFGHGTFCAGLAGAVTNNGIGIAGVGWNCTIMPIKVIDLKNIDIFISSVAKGIKYATDNGASIVSMSFGTGSYPISLIKDVVDYAYDKGVFLCASAGNSNKPFKQYPAAYKNVVAVAATNQNDGRCTPRDWPNSHLPIIFRLGSNYGHWVDIAAPGNLIYTTIPTYFIENNCSQNYDFVGGGTSFSCPLVAGVAALLLSVNSSLSPVEVKTLLCKNVDPYHSFHYIGTGRLNAYKALADLLSDIEISIKGGFGVKAVITNTGSIDVNNVDWQIFVTGGILGRINKTINGTINLKNGESKTISTGLLFGHGKIIIDVKTDIVEKTVKGKQLSFLSLIK